MNGNKWDKIVIILKGGNEWEGMELDGEQRFTHEKNRPKMGLIGSLI